MAGHVLIGIGLLAQSGDLVQFFPAECKKVPLEFGFKHVVASKVSGVTVSITGAVCEVSLRDGCYLRFRGGQSSRDFCTPVPTKSQEMFSFAMNERNVTNRLSGLDKVIVCNIIDVAVRVGLAITFNTHEPHAM